MLREHRQVLIELIDALSVALTYQFLDILPLTFLQLGNVTSLGFRQTIVLFRGERRGV